MIETPEPPHVHKPQEVGSAVGHTGHRRFETLTTIILVIISACSLYTAYHTSKTMESLVHENARLVRAQSTPLVDFGTGNAVDKRRTIAAMLVNGGSGPARIMQSRFTVDGKAYPTFEDALTSNIPQLRKTPNYLTSGINDTILRVGEERRLFELTEGNGAEDKATWQAVDRLRNRISVEICYCSLFDECWQGSYGIRPVRGVASSGDTAPRHVQACGVSMAGARRAAY